MRLLRKNRSFLIICGVFCGLFLERGRTDLRLLPKAARAKRSDKTACSKRCRSSLRKSIDYDIIFYGVLRPLLNWYGADTLDIEITLAKILHHSLIANQDWTLQELALELYQKEQKNFCLPLSP